jgi:hypothetical protein
VVSRIYAIAVASSMVVRDQGKCSQCVREGGRASGGAASRVVRSSYHLRHRWCRAPDRQCDDRYEYCDAPHRCHDRSVRAGRVAPSPSFVCKARRAETMPSHSHALDSSADDSTPGSITHTRMRHTMICVYCIYMFDGRAHDFLLSSGVVFGSLLDRRALRSFVAGARRSRPHPIAHRRGAHPIQASDTSTGDVRARRPTTARRTRQEAHARTFQRA